MYLSREQVICILVSFSFAGKRFAELELQLLFVELLRNFRVEWGGRSDEVVNTTMKLMNTPDRELKFKFTPLE